MTENPYQAPNSLNDDEPIDEMEAVALTPQVKAAALTMLSMGLLSVLSGAQLITIVRVSSWLAAVPYFFFAVGPVAFWLGRQLYRMKRRGALVGVGFAGTVAVFTFVWLVFSITRGLLMPMQFLLMVLAVAASVLSGLSLAPTRRADATRAHFAKQDMDLDF